MFNIFLCLSILVKNNLPEKQVYDVLVILLDYAISDYDKFHVLIMDTINNISSEFFWNYQSKYM